MHKYRLKIFCIIFFSLSIMFVSGCKGLGDIWMEHIASIDDFPCDGLFYCDVLDSAIMFSETDITFITSEEEKFVAHITRGGALLSQDIDLWAWFYWESGSNIIMIKPTEFPGEFIQGERYFFVRQDNNTEGQGDGLREP